MVHQVMSPSLLHHRQFSEYGPGTARPSCWRHPMVRVSWRLMPVGEDWFAEYFKKPSVPLVIPVMQQWCVAQ